MNETLLAFGRGCIKVLVSLFVGSGIGLLTFGITTKDVRDLWEMNGPPPEFFQAMGAGVLAAGAMMALLFFIPRLRKTEAALSAKPAAYQELTP